MTFALFEAAMNRSFFSRAVRALSAALALSLLASGSALAQQESCGPASTFEVGFSSNVNGGEERALDVVLRAIGEARSQIWVAAYEFTSRPIAKALIAAQTRGVQVMVIADWQENSRGFSVVPILQAARVPVRLAQAYKVFHNKFMVIDGETVETGSFNYTVAASEHNAENALVQRQCRPMAVHYAGIWQRLWIEAGVGASQ
jgi:phosphatidylserine/phosphatidylglycerophosphate/cardiolipin synthase-like enzyme